MGKELVPKGLRQLSLPALAAMELASAACGVSPKVGANPDNPTDRSTQLPFSGVWYLTGGPHSDGLSKGVRYALDFAPKRVASCPGSKPDENDKVLAVAAGKVTVVGNEKDPTDKNHSIVKIDHGEGETSGYMHLSDIKVKVGQEIKTGDHLGTPSCDSPPGGKTEGIHLHLFREKDGQPTSVEGITLSRWMIKNSEGNYQGTMSNGTLVRTADRRRCDNDTECNGIRNDISIDSVQKPPTSGPTATYTATVTSSPTVTPTSTETPKPTETPITKNLKTGDKVEVYNVNPECLRVRKEPNTSAPQIDCIKDESVSVLGHGPVVNENYRWWELKSFGGYAVEDYLKLTSRTPEVTSPPVTSLGSYTSLQAAEGFTKAAIKKDLNEARRYFAPDKQPNSWDQVFPLDASWAANRPNLKVDLSQCSGIPYVPVERSVYNWQVFTISFQEPCIRAFPGIFSRNPNEPAYYKALTVPVERANNRWYVAQSFNVGNQWYYLAQAAQ